MKTRFQRIRRWTFWVAISLLLLSMSNSTRYLNPAQMAASPYLYNIVEWEFQNFLTKWVHRLGQALPGHPDQAERQAAFEQYFQLGQEERRLARELRDAAAFDDLQIRDKILSSLSDLRAQRQKMRADVEETIEAGISSVIVDEDLSTVGQFIFPPVDIRLGDPPKLLITSPRDRIERVHDVLLSTDVTLQEREAIESQLLTESDMAALVENIGGLATYPASIPKNQPMGWTFQAAAHEWMHHYMFFRPLGQNMFKTSEMITLNETVASIAGDEMGDMAYVLLGGELPAEVPAPLAEDIVEASENVHDKDDELVFDFNREMRQTRLRVDDLLGQGKIDEAEEYMEKRRLFFVANQYSIRKLNQAYFAFYGTYADTAASVSPIGDQLVRFRSFMPDLGMFIRTVSGVSSYEEFLEMFSELEG
jgi:hypothetical protein